MKRLTALCLILICLFCAVSCGGAKDIASSAKVKSSDQSLTSIESVDSAEASSTVSSAETATAQSAPPATSQNGSSSSIGTKSTSSRAVSQTASRNPATSSADPASSKPQPTGFAHITIKGHSGQILLERTKLPLYEKISVFAFTRDTCETKEIPIEYDERFYISKIGALKEYDLGPQSGWVFTLNDKMINVSSNNIQVKDGDNVVWAYVAKPVTSGVQP